MTAQVRQIVVRLEAVGGRLELTSGRIRYAIPSTNPEARSLLAELRKRRDEVIELLNSRLCLSGHDYYEWRTKIALQQLCRPDYPAGMIPWLAAFSPALYDELTSRLPDRIQRLWDSRAPFAVFDEACYELVECHRSAVELFRKHRGDHHDHDNHED